MIVFRVARLETRSLVCSGCLSLPYSKMASTTAQMDKANLIYLLYIYYILIIYIDLLYVYYIFIIYIIIYIILYILLYILWKRWYFHMRDNQEHSANTKHIRNSKFVGPADRFADQPANPPAHSVDPIRPPNRPPGHPLGSPPWLGRLIHATEVESSMCP